jgi:hypothetical protein
VIIKKVRSISGLALWEYRTKPNEHVQIMEERNAVLKSRITVIKYKIHNTERNAIMADGNLDVNSSILPVKCATATTNQYGRGVLLSRYSLLNVGIMYSLFFIISCAVTDTKAS